MENGILRAYKKEMRTELEAILEYWMNFSLDDKHGGFVGQVDNDNQVDFTAPKGSVLNSRILWSFSAAYNLTGNERYLQVATRARDYILKHFIDADYGGVYWTIDYLGKPLDTKKQMYALSFAIYGLSEYCIATKDEVAKKAAWSLYQSILHLSYDPVYGGYFEATTRDGKPLEDLRLSSKDFNEKKSMNTHLHLLEGFANLYKVFPDEGLRNKIEELVELILTRIVDPKSNHLVLFFDEQWRQKSEIISYGHDIEAAWLLLDAVEVINQPALVDRVKKQSLLLADAASRGLDRDGGLWYEYEAACSHLVKEKHWWPQAEAMVGYFNAWQLTADISYLKKSMQSWQFIKDHLLNKQKGEWYWGITETYTIMPNQDKVGLWKCPYHNSRACIEIIKRTDGLLE